MSYEVHSYAFLGLKVEDIAEAIDPAVVVNLCPGGMLVALDEKFYVSYEKFFRQNPEVFTMTPEDIRNLDPMVDPGGSWATKRSDNIGRFFLKGIGVNDGFFFQDNQHLSPGFDFLPLNEVFVLAGESMCESGKNYVVSNQDWVRIFTDSIIPYLSNCGMINAVHGEGEWLDDPEREVPTACLNLRESLIRLLGKQRETKLRETFTGVEEKIEYLISEYLAERGIQTIVEVISTRWGNVVDNGEMEQDTPYLAFEGAVAYEEEGWDDPRVEEDRLSALQAVEKALLGQAYAGTELEGEGGFKLLTPQFGG